MCLQADAQTNLNLCCTDIPTCTGSNTNVNVTLHHSQSMLSWNIFRIFFRVQGGMSELATLSLRYTSCTELCCKRKIEKPTKTITRKIL